jgi:NADH:ubiquinone oxidoreductase subunit B-like Fe-S oxidoreductase
MEETPAIDSLFHSNGQAKTAENDVIMTSVEELTNWAKANSCRPLRRATIWIGLGFFRGPRLGSRM